VSEFEEIEIFTEIKLGVSFARENFEVDGMSWSEFLEEILTDKQAMKELFTITILDEAKDLMEGIAERIEHDQYVLLVQLTTKAGRKVPKSVRDELDN